MAGISEIVNLFRQAYEMDYDEPRSRGFVEREIGRPLARSDYDGIRDYAATGHGENPQFMNMLHAVGSAPPPAAPQFFEENIQVQQQQQMSYEQNTSLDVDVTQVSTDIDENAAHAEDSVVVQQGSLDNSGVLNTGDGNQIAQGGTIANDSQLAGGDIVNASDYASVVNDSYVSDSAVGAGAVNADGDVFQAGDDANVMSFGDNAHVGNMAVEGSQIQDNDMSFSGVSGNVAVGGDVTDVQNMGGTMSFGSGVAVSNEDGIVNFGDMDDVNQFNGANINASGGSAIGLDDSQAMGYQDNSYDSAQSFEANDSFNQDNDGFDVDVQVDAPPMAAPEPPPMPDMDNDMDMDMDMNM